MLKDLLYPNRVIKVGEMLIYKTPVNNQILILPDRKKLRRIGFIIILFAAGMVFYMARNNFKPGQLLLCFAIATPFALLGLGYIKQASKKKLREIIIDLETKKIVTHGIAIPYNRIACLSMTRLIDPNEIVSWAEYDYSYQLHIRMIDGKEIMLFTDEHKGNIEEAAEFISQQTGLSIDPNTKNA